MRGRSSLSRQHQRGFGLLEALLVTLLLGGTLIAGFLWLQVRHATNAATDQVAALRHADAAVAGFAATHYRLPCPDTDDDGLEDCGAGGERGSLPWRTLRVADPALRARIAQLDYIIDRTGRDLAVSANAFRPGKLGTAEFRQITGDGLIDDAAAGAGEFHALDNVGSVDFCVMLGTSASAGGPEIAGGGGPFAYAVVDPGVVDADGDGDPFDATNAAGGTTVESPQRGTNADYDDRVLARGHANLSTALNCPGLALSLDSVALAQSVVHEVDSQLKWLTASASVATAANGVRVGIQIKKLADSITLLSTASTELGLASSALAAAIGSCVVIVGCAEIPHAAAWTAAAAVAVAAASVAVSANVTAIAFHAAATATTLSAAILAGTSIDETGGSINLSELRETAQDGYEKAVEQRDEAEENLQDARDEEADSLADLRQARAGLYDGARMLVEERNEKSDYSDYPLDHLDPYLDDVRTAARDLQKAYTAEEEAKEAFENALDASSENDDADPDELDGAMDRAREELREEIANEDDPDRRAELEAALATLEDNVNTSNDEQADKLRASIADIDARIDELDETIAEEDDPDRRDDLEARRDDLVDARQRLEDQLDDIQPDLDAKVQAVEDAVAATEAAESDYADARQDAIDAARMHYWRCDEDDQGNCHWSYETHDGRGVIKMLIDNYADALEDWWVRGQEVAVAERQLAEAREAVTRAEQARDALADVSYSGNDASAIVVWDKTDEALRAADRKGGTQ